MFAASKFGRRLPAIDMTDQDVELVSRVEAELQQYIDNMDHVKFVDYFYLFNIYYCSCTHRTCNIIIVKAYMQGFFSVFLYTKNRQFL